MPFKWEILCKLSQSYQGLVDLKKQKTKKGDCVQYRAVTISRLVTTTSTTNLIVAMSFEAL